MKTITIQNSTKRTIYGCTRGLTPADYMAIARTFFLFSILYLAISLLAGNNFRTDSFGLTNLAIGVVGLSLMIAIVVGPDWYLRKYRLQLQTQIAPAVDLLTLKAKLPGVPSSNALKWFQWISKPVLAAFLLLGALLPSPSGMNYPFFFTFQFAWLSHSLNTLRSTNELRVTSIGLIMETSYMTMFFPWGNISDLNLVEEQRTPVLRLNFLKEGEHFPTQIRILLPEITGSDRTHLLELIEQYAPSSQLLPSSKS